MSLKLMDSGLTRLRQAIGKLCLAGSSLLQAWGVRLQAEEQISGSLTTPSKPVRKRTRKESGKASGIGMSMTFLPGLSPAENRFLFRPDGMRMILEEESSNGKPHVG